MWCCDHLPPAIYRGKSGPCHVQLINCRTGGSGWYHGKYWGQVGTVAQCLQMNTGYCWLWLESVLHQVIGLHTEDVKDVDTGINLCSVDHGSIGLVTVTQIIMMLACHNSVWHITHFTPIIKIKVRLFVTHRWQMHCCGFNKKVYIWIEIKTRWA